MRDAIVEVDQKREVVLTPFVSLPEPVGNSDPVDSLASVVQIAHRAKNALVPFEREIIRGKGHDFAELGIVQQDGAEDKSLRINVTGQFVGRQLILLDRVNLCRFGRTVGPPAPRLATHLGLPV
ncbi:MAG: hypothetical protein ABSH44_20645 [Bryobacteraceae bacterium]